MSVSLGNVKDVKVEIRVELGRTMKSLQDLAGVGEGTIMELDKLAGEPVDVVAAGELIAKGEVVVIDERFGIRITQLLGREALK